MKLKQLSQEELETKLLELFEIEAPLNVTTFKHVIACDIMRRIPDTPENQHDRLRYMYTGSAEYGTHEYAVSWVELEDLDTYKLTLHIWHNSKYKKCGSMILPRD